MDDVGWGIAVKRNICGKVSLVIFTVAIFTCIPAKLVFPWKTIVDTDN